MAVWQTIKDSIGLKPVDQVTIICESAPFLALASFFEAPTFEGSYCLFFFFFP